MGDQKITVKLVIDNKIIYVPYIPGQTTAEDACTFVCKQLGIGTVARHIFALRDPKSQHMMPAQCIDSKTGSNFDFRVRYKIPNVMRLKKVDAKAYEYYFHQVRMDIIESKVLDIPFETNRRQLLGLGVTDMYRVMLEKEIPQESIVNDYKKYIPKEVLNRHSIFVKRPIKDALNKLSKQRHQGHDAAYVIDAYLREFETMAQEYPLEEFQAVIDQNGAIYNIVLRVSPFHATEPGIKYCNESNKDKWHLICTIDEVCFVSIRDDCSIELSRRNGIPFYVKFNSIMKMRSFVSLVDGYYRLSVKWIFNICKDVVTPSLQKLYAMKCHGPVGGEFSYAKLEEKRSNHHGCFIIRESELKYNLYFVDVCTGENVKPKTFKLERLSNEEFVFNDDLTKYQNLSQLMAAYNDSQGAIYLGECLPPSENDNSPLLLCKATSQTEDVLTEIEDNLTLTNPICINTSDLQVFSASKRESSTNISIVYKGRWKYTKRKKTDVAVKVLKDEYKDRYLKEFLDLAGQWAFLQSYVIVKLYGVTMRKQLSMVMEYVPLGPLDQYLRDSRSKIQSVDLMEASSNLAFALWYLAENGIVHGNIRCKKVLVASHDVNHFKVKLSDPGLHAAYSPKEVHWIPVEFYKNLHLDFARRSETTDVWAFGTTVYEIYNLGDPIAPTEHSEVMKQFYINGKRLPMMKTCPPEVYKLLLECWDPDPARRKQPQAIMRDFNQMLYQVYNSRKKHAYAEIKPRSHDTRSLESSLSVSTDTTSVAGTDDFSAADGQSISNWSLDSENNPLLLPSGLYERDDDTLSISFHASSLMGAAHATDWLSIHRIFELDADRVVDVQGRIGQGCYGEVFKATLEFIGDKKAPKRLVAVKKLKARNEEETEDFEREISIMKRLKHKNIVEILGVLSTEGPSMVMEYVPHGSLDSYLKINKDTLTDRQLLRYASDIAEGMDYLGKMSIVHRDLAARNILVVDDNHVKISDFGLAQVLNADNYYILKHERNLPIRWYALESLTQAKFSTRSDVWSFGVTLCEMHLRGEDPRLPIEIKTETPELVQLIEAYDSGIRLNRPILCPQLIYVEIIYPCWNADPHQRPTFQALYNKITELLPQY